MDQRIEGHGAGCDLAPDWNPGTCAWCQGELPPRRKRFCSDLCGARWYENHRWTQARLAALERAGYRCERCGEAPLDGLEVHHRIEVGAEGYGTLSCLHHQANLEVLDSRCHREEHAFRHEVDRLVRTTRQLVLPLG